MMYGQWANVCLQIIYSRNKLVKSVSKQAKKTGKRIKTFGHVMKCHFICNTYVFG